MKNKYKVITTTQYLRHMNWPQADLAIIYSGDIRQPWKSVYGFSTTAARLAAGYPMVLHCREDEVFNFMTGLNDLLGNPESLNLAYKLLIELRQVIRNRVISLIKIEQQPIAPDDAVGVAAAAEQILTERSIRPSVDRLENTLSPNYPGQELRGKIKTLVRLNVLTLALEQTKDKGFHVVVLDKRRKSVRPFGNLERNTGLMPVKYHLTLWSYLVARSDNGQAVVWN